MKRNHNGTHSTATATHPGQKHLVEDAQALLSATAHVAGDKVMEARKRLSAAIDKGRESLDNISDKAIDSAKATDRIIRANPYKAIGAALCVGALIGYFMSRRNR